jgi:hypothetical protein
MGDRRRVVVAGGGAAGFMAAIECADADPRCEVSLHEATAHPLAKVRISGGGRCNVTHACFDAKEMAKCYPRGSRELIGPLSRFGPAETIAWFGERGVELKTEEDGRMFPVTDDSSTIVDCLMSEARKAGVTVATRSPVRSIARVAAGSPGRFTVRFPDGAEVTADRVLIATGGPKEPPGGTLAEGLGHSIEPPVPSLFTFHIEDPRIKGLEGLAVPTATAAVPGTDLAESGPVW